ncbi:MAG: type II toxin-antitoxin system VapC family toxin [Cyanobacteria bacterium P01_H01_bin.152]
MSVSSSSKKAKMSVFYLDSSVFIDFLNKASLTKPKVSEEVKERHKLALSILKHGEEKKSEIVTSTFTQSEVCRVLGQGLSEVQQEQQIKALFARPWIRSINFERKVAEVSRVITRRVGTAPKDSIHMATAIRHGIDYFVSSDRDFLDRTTEFLTQLEDDFPNIRKINITNWPQEVIRQDSVL